MFVHHFQFTKAANIAEVATQAGFSKLVEYVAAAGLVDTLANGGPFTVFAPTNEAFAKLPPSIVQALQQDPELLKSVLLYHVVAGKVQSSDLKDELVVNSVQGSALRFNMFMEDPAFRHVGKRSAQRNFPRAHSNAFFAVNGKKIVKADVQADNGVIHVIDEVIYPFADKTVVEVLAGNPDYSTLVTAVQAAGLVDTLNSAGPFTIFAPNNAAFAKIPPATLNGLLGNKPALTKILLRHVIPDTLFAVGIGRSVTVNTVGKDELFVSKCLFGIVSVTSTVDGTSTKARVKQADLIGTNGVVHGIDTVI